MVSIAQLEELIVPVLGNLNVIDVFEALFLIEVLFAESLIGYVYIAMY